MLGSVFEGDQAALFYEGVDQNSNVKTRVAEFLTIRDERIAEIVAVISPLG